MKIFIPSNIREAKLREKCASLRCPFAGLLEIIPDQDDNFESNLVCDEMGNILKQAIDMGLYSLRIIGAHLAQEDILCLIEEMRSYGLVISLEETIDLQPSQCWIDRFYCYAGQCEFYLTSSGIMKPCKFIEDSNFIFDLKEKSFSDAWQAMSTNFQSCKYKSDVSPLVSVIVPIYNCEQYLRKCIESIIFQSLKSIEIILVDDGSSDSSGIICDEYAKIDTRIHVFHQENGGVSSARNTGLKNAHGRYIMFCDSDDYVYDCWCEVLLGNLMKHPDSMIIGNTHFGKNPETQKISVRLDQTLTNDLSLPLVREMPLYAYVWNKIYRADLLTDHNIMFDEAVYYNEDAEFNRRYLELCKSGYFVKRPLSYHLIRPGSLVSMTESDNNYDPASDGRIVWANYENN